MCQEIFFLFKLLAAYHSSMQSSGKVNSTAIMYISTYLTNTCKIYTQALCAAFSRKRLLKCWNANLDIPEKILGSF